MKTANYPTIARIIVVGVTVLLLNFHARAGASVHSNDRIVSAAIKVQLNKQKLNYPHSVERFYKRTAYKLGWIAPDTVKMHAFDAMLLLDCVLQYGFGHQDFHPHELEYDQLHLLTEVNGDADVAKKASFDILLTDAMITFINHLHYGKINPGFSASKIDQETKNLNAANLLANAMSDQNFMITLLSVQPKSRVYKNLQDMMRLITAQYIGDCYEVPAGQIRKIAINMERLRWLNNTTTNYITINVPNNSLWYHNGGQVDHFKVDVELPLTLLPITQTTLIALRTGTQFSLLQQKTNASKGLLVLDFQNDFQSYFPIGDHSHVFVEHGERLAELLLFNDDSATEIQQLFQAMQTGRQKRFKLKTAVSVKITYITCEMKEGILVEYPDTYHLDKTLEEALNKAKKYN